MQAGWWSASIPRGMVGVGGLSAVPQSRGWLPRCCWEAAHWHRTAGISAQDSKPMSVMPGPWLAGHRQLSSESQCYGAAWTRGGNQDWSVLILCKCLNSNKLSKSHEHPQILLLRADFLNNIWHCRSMLFMNHCSALVCSSANASPSECLVLWQQAAELPLLATQQRKLS